MNARVYQASFALLERDLEALLEFVEPVDANAACFSHRSYALLLRACTEFESLAKDLLVEGGSTKNPKDMDVNDYRTLELACKFEGVTVDFLPWRPHPKQMSPYKGWSTAKPPLRWYADYNVVKHNRNARFELANLETLVESISALFCLVAKASDYDWRPL